MALSPEQLRKYWDTADILRKNIDAAEYKHIVLGLVFLKFVSDSFESRRLELEKEFSDPKSDTYKKDESRRTAALDERDYYKAVNVFWVPENSRWTTIQENSKQPDIAQKVDNALYEIEKENPKLEGIVERRYSDAKLPAADLGAVVDLIGSINFGSNKSEASDVLGQVYEFFLGNFASAEGKNGGQFYTTPSIVRTLVEVLQPTSGRVYDPCCGSGGMFVQSEKFVEAHGGKIGNISIYGQESNPTTRRLCAMNLAIRGIDFDLGKTNGDTFTENQHEDKKFDYILMNPPFGINASYPKLQLANDVRWKKYGIPRERPANYAWMSHAIHHLAPKGRAGIVMPHATLTSTSGGDDQIRKAFLEDDIVECIIDLPGQLFFNTPIPSCLWFFNKSKSSFKNKRDGQVLVLDARGLGKPISKTQIEFTDEEIELISKTYNDWANGSYEDVAGFCKSVTKDEIKEKSYSLSPGRYIGTEADDETGSEFELSIQSIAQNLVSQLNEIAKQGSLIQDELRNLGIETVDSSTATSNSSLPVNLESFVSTLFKSWFIDFQPDSEASGDYMKVVNEFMPDERIKSIIGDIPKGWKVVKADEIFDISIGRTPPRKEPEWFCKGSEGVPWVSIRDMGTYSVFGGKTSEGLTVEAVEKFRVPVVPKDTVLMSFKLTVGKLCITTADVVTNEAIAHFVTRPGINLPSAYIYLWLKHFDIENLDSTSSIGRATNSKEIRNIPFLIPPKEIVDAFAKLVEPFFNLIRVVSESSSEAELEN